MEKINLAPDILLFTLYYITQFILIFCWVLALLKRRLVKHLFFFIKKCSIFDRLIFRFIIVCLQIHSKQIMKKIIQSDFRIRNLKLASEILSLEILSRRVVFNRSKFENLSSWTRYLKLLFDVEVDFIIFLKFDLHFVMDLMLHRTRRVRKRIHLNLI